LISLSSFAQNDDYSKLNKEDLITKNKELKESVENCKKAKEKQVSEKAGWSNKEILQLKTIIKETNETFLRELFKNKYVLDTNYFKDTELANDDNTKKFENSTILLNSILADESTSEEDKKLGRKALVFNVNYLTLFQIKKTLFYQKYDEIKVTEAIKNIDNLPLLEEDSKLHKEKTNIKAFLSNYKGNSCALKKQLDQYRTNPDQSTTFKQVYTKLESNPHYKDYPYLIEIIKKIKSNVNLYTADDLGPCEVETAAVPINTSTPENSKTVEKEVNKTDVIKVEKSKPEENKTATKQ
jgi:hypothetical protein